MKEHDVQHSPRPPTYTRQTVIAAADMLKALGHSGFDRFLLELELSDDQAGRGPGLLARATSIAEYAIKNPTQVTPDGLTIPVALVERAINLWREEVVNNLKDGDRGKFEEAMKREGQELAVQIGRDNGSNSLEKQIIMTNSDTSGIKYFRNVIESSMAVGVTKSARKIFLVHGHDDGARETIARFLERLDFEVIILHEQANQGRTIIEKVEAHGDVNFAVVLLTPDDEGGRKGETPKPRARQNVILEIGYFVGRLGRMRVCVLIRGDVEIPSDFGGVVYEQFDGLGGWKLALGRELRAAGFDIDLNKAMRF